MGWVAAVAEVARVAGSIHINSAMFVRFLLFFLFPYFLFSSFHLFLFPRLSYHAFIFHIFIFTYSHIFKKCSAHEQYALRQEDVS
jgi:hypothetical protein